MAANDAADISPAEECDVLVIGGGPAGSTAATLLAERGHRVVIAEKMHYPRFHIGESLLPANLPLFERLGVGDEIRALGMVKRGVQFVSPWHEKTSQTFSFKDAWDKSLDHAYQVRRSEFDQVLLRNAERKGVTVHEGCQVNTVEDGAAGAGMLVRAEGESGPRIWQARYVMDASGRDTFMGNRERMKHRNPRHNSASLYAHFRGAIRQEGEAEGDISIFWFQHGWLWFIPLPDGATSVGAVTWPYYMKTRQTDVETFFRDIIAQAPGLAARLAGAEMVTPVEATGNFSYSCDRAYGRNYVLLGDALSFIDPVFSSGVLLAMQSAFYAADAVDTCLREPAKGPAAMQSYERAMRTGLKKLSWFIYRINHPSMRDLFMGPRNVFRVKEALLSVLAGDIFGDTPIWRSVAIFKTIYYLDQVRHPRRSIMAWRRRRASIGV
ncbi:NAD(P)/FAD-dependent oxidoreductase [Acidiferrobacter sp.]|uniref:NAD(P)/FAD-dependent oxidoreductase n=1 Tax=Acidiferrobacter sp. TaxID=1872107 RepID=UPI002604FC00|nr:NAD(P)/FAD-dependent oxidoreductase [Acidiferrobacter sp.]